MQKVVYIKASLSDARARLERYRKRNNIPHPLPESLSVQDLELPIEMVSVDGACDSEAFNKRDDGTESAATGAFVYVMRCHAHAEHLFKVGFTDRDPQIRASELSSTTSTPSPFLVLRTWAVSNGQQAERAAHQELKDVRLSQNREFFQIEYEELRDRLDIAVRQWLI